MSTFIGDIRDVRFTVRADCSKCDGLGIIATAKRPNAADVVQIVIEFCNCAKMFRVAARESQAPPKRGGS